MLCLQDHGFRENSREVLKRLCACVDAQLSRPVLASLVCVITEHAVWLLTFPAYCLKALICHQIAPNFWLGLMKPLDHYSTVNPLQIPNPHNHPQHPMWSTQSLWNC